MDIASKQTNFCTGIHFRVFMHSIFANNEKKEVIHRKVITNPNVSPHVKPKIIWVDQISSNPMTRELDRL